MIRDFDDLKRQLNELATILNKFNSETVQLRLVELIFRPHGQADLADVDESVRGSSGARRSKKARKPSAPKADTRHPKKGKRGAGRRKGSAAILNDLINEGYFASRRTLNDIMQHCSSQKARSFKPNELSSPLARFVRDNRLKRDKNADGQYEYYTA